MRTNLALWDRILRFAFGVLLSIWAFAGGPFWAYFGIYLIITSAWGFDPSYAFLKVSTIKHEAPRSVPSE